MGGTLLARTCVSFRGRGGLFARAGFAVPVRSRCLRPHSAQHVRGSDVVTLLTVHHFSEPVAGDADAGGLASPSRYGVLGRRSAQRSDLPVAPRTVIHL